MMGKRKSNDWTDPRCVIKCIGPKLVPFFKTVAIYFVLADRESETWLNCVLKCLPIIWLCIFVVLNGISFEERHAYSRRILVGLIFSMIGDAFLVGSSTFLCGLLSFSIAHVCYTFAFGFKPLKLVTGVLSAAPAVVAFLVLFPRLDGILQFAVPYYITLITLMLWRSLAAVEMFDDVWTWTKLSSCFGGILFTVSDSLLALNTFGGDYVEKIGFTSKQCQAFVMVTYYAAQMGIALSVVDSKSILALSESQKKAEKTK